MRQFLTAVGVCVALGSAVSTFAQSPKQTAYDPDIVRLTGQRPSPAEQIIHERAFHEARERESRLESRRWHGISAQRPSVYAGTFSGSEILHISPWHYPGPYLYTRPLCVP